MSPRATEGVNPDPEPWGLRHRLDRAEAGATLEHFTLREIERLATVLGLDPDALAPDRVQLDLGAEDLAPLDRAP